MKKSLAPVIVFLLHAFLVVTGCFITNCPPGGKRSSGSDIKIKQCETCGPQGMNGLCYGPHICCSSEGCMMGTPETATCMQENLVRSTPCQNPGESCSGNDDGNPINGQCAASGVCCSSETCTVDDTCHGQPKDLSPKSHSSPMKERLTIFMNPLDRWIPRRLGLVSGHKVPRRIEPRKPWQSPAENSVGEHVLNTDNLKVSNEEYY